MKINKLISILILAAMAMAPSDVFAEAQNAKTPKQEAAVKKTAKPDYSFLNGKTGVVILNRRSEENFTDILNTRFGSRMNKLIYTDSMAGSLSMLKSGRADFMMTPNIVADYVIKRNPDLKYIVFNSDLNLVMLLRDSDLKLRDLFDSALEKLKASGKLAEVYKKWVTELPAGQDPAIPAIEKTSYPETIYVGVSGDMPPLDYVSADGKPAGYNIALLVEISKIIEKNIEVISLDSGGRFAALQSKKIDVFFWQVRPNRKLQESVYKKLAGAKSFSEKYIFTKPYCAIKSGVLLKK